MTGTFNYMVALSMALSIAGTALADPLDAATAAFNQGDYEGALRLLQPLAQEGNRGAQYNLGMMYNEGRGVPRNSAEALKWFQRAADQGDREAQRDLAYLYKHGDGIPRNNVEAFKWYRLAAEQGDAVAQFNVGYMYGSGEGTRVNNVEAYRWFALAVENLAFSDSFNRGKATRNRDAMAELMSAQDLALAKSLVRDWKPKP
jgi:TPR repeat protein